MKIKNKGEISPDIMDDGEVSGIKFYPMITAKDGAPNFAMRLFEIGPNGYTPKHTHEWEHEVFILEGSGITRDKNKEGAFKAGDVFFVPGMEWHQFVNTGKETLKFLCLIPYKE